MILAAVLYCCPWIAFAQFTLEGLVSDGMTFLPGVHVLLFRDSTLVSACQTDSLGRYQLVNVTEGVHRLSCSLIGYAPFNSTVRVRGERSLFIVPEILMSESLLELRVVEITADRLSVEQHPDHTIIRPAASATSAGNNALEVLQKSPGVTINRQSGVISVNGRQGVRLMINDKVMPVSGDMILQVLEAINTSQIDRIELITVPSSGYDAEGSGGIIKVVMHEDTEQGTHGSVSVTLGTRWAEGYGWSVNLTRRTPAAAYFLDYSGSRNHNQHIMTMRRSMIVAEQPLTMSDYSPRENITDQHNISLGAEWKVRDRILLNAWVTGYSRNWQLDAVAYNTTVFDGDSIRETAMNATESNVWQSATTSIGVQVEVNDRRRIDASLDYLFYHNNNPSHYEGNLPETDKIQLTKKTPIHFVVASLQYLSQDMSSKFSWDVGVKAVLSTLENRVVMLREFQGQWIIDDRLSSEATQREKIFAAYISTVWKPGANWHIHGGLRYEYTSTEIIADDAEAQLLRRYGNLFPQLTIRKQLHGGNEWFVSYSRRIVRPTYNDMAPYVFFWGPESFSAGNTNLLPALTDAVTLSVRRGAWLWTAAYSGTVNTIAMMQPGMVDGYTMVLRTQNLNRNAMLSGTASYNTQLFPWWDVRAEVMVWQQWLTAEHLPVPIHRSLAGVNASAASICKLPARFTFEVSGVYQSRTPLGVSDFLPSGSLNLALAKQIGHRSSLKLAVDDLFTTSQWRIRTRSHENNLDVDFNYDWNNRFARLTYVWNLGNQKIPGLKTKAGAEEERRRVTP